ncbi:MAG TPA: hypothetical protein DEF18_09875 [Muricauda sp.]|nr:hypothetical protein [Allomuricauda sp.]|tara:strand:+ start:2119 stop:2451 length:333 start_codon:yes stop_codon:yes gene_type:complete
MNNSKWVKLISVLVVNYHLIEEIDVKLIFDKKIRKLKISGNEQFNFDYYPNAMESMVTDPVNPGWTMYKEIEWIEIKGSQVNKELAEMIKGIGKFNIDSHPKKLRLSAYI